MKTKPFRYDTDQGFEQPQNYHSEIILDLPVCSPVSNINSPKIQKKHRSYSNKRQQTKLKFLSIERDRTISSNYSYNQNDDTTGKLKNQSQSLTIEQNNSIRKRTKVPTVFKRNNFESFKSAVIKAQRNQIGQSLQLQKFNIGEKTQIKEAAINSGASVVYEEPRQSNSHGYLKKIMKLKDKDIFIKSKYNKALLLKVNESSIFPKTDTTRIKHNEKSVEFVSDFESANLDFVTQVNPFEYDIYLKADTNSMGHQNWFYFKIFYSLQNSSNIFLNVCNLKRSFKMVKKGQKVYFRFRNRHNELETGIQSVQWSQWEKIQEDVNVILNPDLSKCINGKRKKVYKLSFAFTLKPNLEYEVSLLPPFTYSKMLKEIQTLEDKCPHMSVQVLSYSLIGLAIPLVTFQIENEVEDKNVTIISARIHPGETCGSFVASGILNKLAQNNEDVGAFLAKNIVKIIPMINPDGVVLGNFRTNYLGDDLNRSFNKSDEALYPEVNALKVLGERLLKEHREGLVCFLDLHGHSSQKNIFSYGPQFDPTHKNYVSSRFLPKVLGHLADEFDYGMCTFKLEEHKCNTARGYFLNHLKVIAFTVQSSYALYDSKLEGKGSNLTLMMQNWNQFGKNVIKALKIWTESITIQSSNEKKKNFSIRDELDKIKSQSERSKKQESNLEFINKIKRQLRKQALLPKKVKKDKNKGDENGSSSQDSDGESESQDLPVKQRTKMQRRIKEGNSGGLFPRILRPAIIHPQVNPPLFTVNKISPSTKGDTYQKNSHVLSTLRLKRNNRNTTMKPMNVNNAYTEYLIKEVKGLESLKPSVNLMKLERKDSIVMNPKK